jgi:peptidoglycan/LPS O-acetylase OafA/YrhL
LTKKDKLDTMKSQKRNKIVSIQLLRAIAALSVVYRHSTAAGDYNFPPAGAFGFDIFFIISGFIIAYMVSGNTENFLVKRIIRIAPLYVLATIVMTMTVAFFPNLIGSTTISFSGFIKSVLFIPGPENRGYPILGQGWTLNFEMLFYFIMFLCIIIVKNKKYLTIACIFVLIFIMATLNLLKSENFIFNYYKNGLFPELIYGMILYHCYVYFNKNGKKIFYNKNIKIIFLTFLGIISYGFMIFSDVYNFHLTTNRNIDYGIPSLILIVSLLFLEKEIKDHRIIRFGILLGEASYVMYLIHYHVVIFLARVVFNKTIGANSIFIIEIIKIIIAFIVTIILSIMIYKYIDKPIQNIFRKLLKNNGIRANST